MRNLDLIKIKRIPRCSYSAQNWNPFCRAWLVPGSRLPAGNNRLCDLNLQNRGMKIILKNWSSDAETHTSYLQQRKLVLVTGD